MGEFALTVASFEVNIPLVHISRGNRCFGMLYNGFAETQDAVPQANVLQCLAIPETFGT
jgi:hypothetical protein